MKRIYKFDFENLTLDGNPMQSEDISLIVGRWSMKHLDDEMWRKVVAVIVSNNYTQKYKRGKRE